MAKIEEKIELLLLPILTNMNYELYDVEYIKEGKEYFLRIFIDKPNGIDLNDCEKVSNAISDVLDKANYIKEQYFLEVSSAGIERILRKEKHLKENIGTKVELKLYKAIDRKKQYIGVLQQFDEENISLLIEKEVLTFERNNVAQIKTVYDWN